jgi:perosamine synthetase
VRIPLSKPDIGELELEYVTRVLQSGRLSLGPALAEFEERFAAYVGVRYAVATNSGTSALHLCVKALGIGPGDEVLTSSFSFVASANCVLHEGALPAFVDIHPATLNLDPERIREAIARDYVWDGERAQLVNRISGRLLKAILPVHVFGLPCEMGPILEIARSFNLCVIEDACEALGASCDGQSVGTFGEAAAFAFYPNKQMTTAEGGIVVTNDPTIADTCRSLRNQGRDESAAWLRHARLGYNYRLSDLHCALGLAQLERIDELLAARERAANRYSSLLAGIPDIASLHDPLETKTGTKRSWFVYVIRLLGSSAPRLRDELVDALRERGIACQTYFEAIHRQPYFREIDLAPRRPLPCTDAASESCLALPFFPSMSEEQVAEVCVVVREILEREGAAERGKRARLVKVVTVGG